MDANSIYYAFEFLLYGSLKNLISAEKVDKLLGVAEDVARLYTAEIVTGLKAMHNAGIMHCDLTTSNLLIGEDLHLRIVSFQN